MDLVSIVIPCREPGSYLIEAIASAKAQTHRSVEIIVVDNGSRSAASKEVLRTASQQVDRYIEHTNQGASAARNAGIRAAGGKFIVPLDCDDLLAPDYVEQCLDALRENPNAAFVYTNYRVFGTQNYVERLPEYNLYRLLENNNITYAALIQKKAWEIARGYDEAMRLGYEDWEFWLRLGAGGKFGYRLNQVLFNYRKHGRSLSDVATEHHDELVSRIRSNHPELYGHSAMAAIKARWEPAVCVVGAAAITEQTVHDWARVDSISCEELLASTAEAFLVPAHGAVSEQTVELAALAVWGGKTRVQLPDGSVALSRSSLQREPDLHRSQGEETLRGDASASLLPCWPSLFGNISRHLANAGLLSGEVWLRHPLQSASRLIPLRFKEFVNRKAKGSIFDLSFYLRFQPNAVILADKVTTPLRYFPRTRNTRQRICLVTPHLGPGGAESVLLEIAKAQDRRQVEILLIATQSRDARWLPRWSERVDHVYDLSSLVSPERLAGAVYSIVTNWQVDTLLIQNALPAYSAVPQLKMHRPSMTIMDLVHAVGDTWDLASCTAEVAPYLDTRVAISEALRKHLRRFGTEEEKIRLIHAGIDLERFAPAAPMESTELKRILFAGRLDPIKRPLLLSEIAAALRKLRPAEDFRIVVAGDGPEEERLRRSLERARIDRFFEFLGHVPDLAPVLAESHLLIILSRNEGIPLVAMEALACCRPVIASRIGAIDELLDESNSILIDPAAGEAEVFAKAIDQLLNQPILRMEMGLAGRRKIEADFDARFSRRAYRELFECKAVAATDGR